jgi:protein TonB
MDRNAGMVDFRAQRALQFALLASLALHAMALFLAPGFRMPDRPPVLPTLTAVLRNLPQSAEPPAVTRELAKEPVKPEEIKPRETAAPARAPRPETAKPRSADAPRMTAPSTDASPSLPAIEAPVMPAAPSTAVATATPGAPASASPRAEPADPVALQGYLVQLSSYAVKYKRYPQLARERGWEGVTVVKLAIGANGRIRDVAVISSSGHELLDQHAIEIVRKAAPITEITSALRNREFSINIPVYFTIERKGG